MALIADQTCTVIMQALDHSWYCLTLLMLFHQEAQEVLVKQGTHTDFLRFCQRFLLSVDPTHEDNKSGIEEFGWYCAL